MKPIQIALISPFYKDNLLLLVEKLEKHNPDITFLATSGSFTLLKDKVKNILTIEDFTGFQESPEGLVKTLHPKIFFGLLGNKDKKEHQEFFNELNIEPIDLVVSNLYPFWELNKKDKKLAISEMTHYWDIGGPSMIMAGIKGNHAVVLTDPNDYNLFIQTLSEDSEIKDKTFKKLNLKALQYVVEYHKMIGEYFGSNIDLLL